MGRGVLPASMLMVEAQVDVLPMYGTGKLPQMLMDSGLFYTDGSGGEFGSLPSLRRCGVGVAHITFGADGMAACDWGVYSGLPGPTQTVPRSELFALLWVLRQADPDKQVEIATDSKVTCSIYHARDAAEAEERDGDHVLHHDLWYALQRALFRRSATATVRCVKKHAMEKPEFIGQYSLTTTDVLGNACADWLAGQGTIVAAPSLRDQAHVLQAISMVGRIQLRLVAILGWWAEKIPRAESTHKKPRVAIISEIGRSLRTTHIIFDVGLDNKRAYCTRCGLSPAGAAR